MKVYVTSRLPLDVEEIFKEAGIECYMSDPFTSRIEMMGYALDADGIICLLRDKIDREFIDNAKNLKIIANYAVGYDNIDVNYAKEKGIYVTNTPDVLTNATADLVFSLMLAAARRISESDRYVRDNNFRGWRSDEMLGVDVYGKTLGIYGFGRIGQSVGKRATGFDMDVIYCDGEEKLTSYKSRRVDFEELIEESDFISVNAPLNKETEYKFTYEVFEKMKRNAVFINTARGKIVKENDLYRALLEGLIKYAGLDVYEDEPSITEGLMDLDNVILLPHIGSATEDTRKKMALLCIESIKETLINKERPKLCVNC